MKTKIVLITVLILFIVGCQDNPVIPEEEQLVLQAYLNAAEPVTDISVMLSKPLTSADTLNTPISTASVLLYKNNTSYVLTLSTQEPGKYYYAGGDLSVQPTEQYKIEVQYNGITSTAETIVPVKPENLSLNISTMTFTTETMTEPFGSGTMQRITTSDSMVISWTNPTGEAFYVVVESVDPNRTVLQSDTMARLMDRRFVTEPMREDHYRVFDRDLNYTGKHKITVYRVNQEYVNLYKSRQQDSRSLNEPITNVKNGLGIFTAFASDSLFFNVILQ